MPKIATAEPMVLGWHPGGAGALWDADLNWHDGREPLDGASRGVKFVVLDHETGADVTGVFLAHWNESRTQVVDPAGSQGA